MNLPGQFSIIQRAEDAQDGRINLLAAVEEEVKVDMGMPTPESGQAAVKALDRAMTDYRNGLYDVLVTAPINNGNAQIENYPFQGHKKYIETCLGEGKKGLSILVGGNLRIASVTEKTPLKEVAAGITTDAIVEKVTLMQQTLKRDFMITNPRIAVLSLNPKSNEDTSCGIEEKKVCRLSVHTHQMSSSDKVTLPTLMVSWRCIMTKLPHHSILSIPRMV